MGSGPLPGSLLPRGPSPSQPVTAGFPGDSGQIVDTTETWVSALQ
jgi:hypothetical protein